MIILFLDLCILLSQVHHITHSLHSVFFERLAIFSELFQAHVDIWPDTH